MRLKVQISHRLQQFSGGTDIKRSVDRTSRAGSFCRSAYMPDRRRHNLFQRISVIMKFKGVGAKGICQNDITPRLNVASVDLSDFLCMSQVPGLRSSPGSRPLS